VSASSPLQTSVRNAIVESQQVLSKEDFLKLMLPENISVEEGRRKVRYFFACNSDSYVGNDRLAFQKFL